MTNAIPVKTIEKEINSICTKKVTGIRTYSGYNVWSPENFLLFETVSDGKYLIRGFTNKDIRRVIFGKQSETVQIS